MSLIRSLFFRNVNARAELQPIYCHAEYCAAIWLNLFQSLNDQADRAAHNSTCSKFDCLSTRRNDAFKIDFD